MILVIEGSFEGALERHACSDDQSQQVKKDCEARTHGLGALRDMFL